MTADAFCWSMVRSLVGAVMAVGEGRRSPDWISGLLAETERSSAVPVAPACGLALVGVDYPADADLAARNLVTREVRPGPGGAAGTDDGAGPGAASGTGSGAGCCGD